MIDRPFPTRTRCLHRLRHGYRRRRTVARGWTRKAAIGLVSVGLVGLVSLPVMAEVASLRSLPLGKGSATITWIGNSGIIPTINSIHGSARGLTVKATGTVPAVPGLGQAPSGSTPSIPSSYPIADIKGTLAGTAFSLTITLKLSGLSFHPSNQTRYVWFRQRLISWSTDYSGTHRPHRTLWSDVSRHYRQRSCDRHH